MATAAAWEEDEHELRNDDGFVYKRRKRRRLEEEAEKLLATQPESSALDLERSLKQRRKIALGKVKDRYRKEILQWELLSNSLKAMQERSQRHQQVPDLAEPGLENELGEPSFQPQLDELLRQVEAQEAIFQDISMLCHAAEAIYKAEEERRKQPFLDLPIWETPQMIFACLCEEDNCNDNADDT